ncbi:hypothetical protein C8Q74DRAFT_323001 [Fomes fomentarius]|nr:hypothetical protein C8Q74DRAFT_323001 [Fomes fomentarius]
MTLRHYHLSSSLVGQPPPPDHIKTDIEPCSVSRYPDSTAATSSSWQEHRTTSSTPRNHPSRLLGEITDAIIDYLHYDKRSLYSCALVCRAWLASSRHHLFRRFSLSNLRPTAAYHRGIVFLTSTPDVECHVLLIELLGQCVCLPELDTLFTALPHLRSLALSDLSNDLLFQDVHILRFRGIEELRISACHSLRHNSSSASSASPRSSDGSCSPSSFMSASTRVWTCCAIPCTRRLSNPLR